MNVEHLSAGNDRLILGCDAAKDIWYGAWMNVQGEVVQTIRWDQVDETGALLTQLQALRAAGVAIDVAVEPTATYADAVVVQLLGPGPGRLPREHEALARLPGDLRRGAERA